MKRSWHRVVGAVLVVAAAAVTLHSERVAQTPERTVSIYVQSPLPAPQALTTIPVFDLSIDGVPVEIVQTVRGPQPLAVVVLFDVSGSMSELDERGAPSGRLDLDRAAKRLAGAALNEDRVRIGTVGSKIAISTTVLTDAKAASKAASEIQQRGGPSPIWDAINRSLDLLAGQPGLHAVLVHSDGQAAGNDLSAVQILTRAQRTGTIVSAVGLGDEGLPEVRQRSMIRILGRNDRLLRLVGETGGSYFEIDDTDQVPDGAVSYFLSAVTSLRQYYRLDFVPPQRDSRLHQVSVTVGGKPARAPKFISVEIGRMP